MRILHVNKFLYRRGGAEGYLLDLAAMQADRGDEVAFFSTAHPDNPPTSYADRFPTYLELNPPPGGLAAKARAVARMFWSSSAASGIDDVVRDFRPDVVHAHNIYHHLSPSVLRPPHERGIPLVMTLHDYKLVCPTHALLAHGRVCEECVGRHFHRAVAVRCSGGSAGASATAAAELAFHTYAGLYGAVDAFVCPSRFLTEMMRRGRVYPERLHVVPNFVHAEGIEAKERAGGGVAYVGRFSPEKGVDTLVRAAADVPAQVELVGDGPERARLEALAREVGATVRFHGHLPLEGAHAVLREAAVSVMPSTGYENMPMAILESFAAGVPVVGTAHGGIPELISPGEDGELVPPADPGSMASALRSILDDPDRAFRMGRVGREKVIERFSPATHLTALDEVYAVAQRRALGRHRRTP